MELKSGETYNGHLEAVDSWMNIKLRDVICTSKVCKHFIFTSNCMRQPEKYLSLHTEYIRVFI